MLKFTQQVLQAHRNSRAALENDNSEEIVDQSVIDSQPTDAVETTEEVVTADATPSEDLPADAGDEEVTDASVTDVPAGDVPAEEPVAELPVTDETVVAEGEGATDGTGVDAIEPPQVVPTADDGEATLDQVEAIAEGNPEEAAEAVAEAQTEEGVPTTTEEVLETAEEVAEETPTEDATETPVESPVDETPAENISSEPAPETNEGDITPDGEEPTSDDVVSDAETEAGEQLDDAQAAIDNPPAPEGDPAVEDAADPEADPAAEPAIDPSVEAVGDCACEADGENVPGDVAEGGKGEEELPAQDKPVDEANGEETLAVQDKPVAEAAGEETLPAQDAVTDEAKGEETLPPQDSAVDEAVVEDVATDVPAETEEDGLLNEEIDVPGDYQETDADTGEVLEGALDTYPQVVEVLEESLDNGGVSMEAMRILQIFAARDGLSVGGQQVSLESYNFTGRAQTRVALEGFKEDLKGWVAQFIEWLKKTAAEGMEWLRKRLVETERLKASADAILANLDSAQSVAGNITFAGMEKLAVKGAIPSDIGSSLNHLAQYSGMFMTAVPAGALNFTQDSIKNLKELVLDKMMGKLDETPDPKDVYAAVAQTGKRYMDNLSHGLFDVREGADSDTVRLYGKTMPGDTRFVFVFPNAGDSRDNVMQPITFSVDRGEGGEVAEAKPLSPDQVKVVVTAVKELIDHVEIGKKYIDGMDKVLKELSTELDRVTNLNANSEENVALKAGFVAVRRLSGILSKLAMDVMTGSIGYFTGVAGASLNYAKSSVSGAKAPAVVPAQA